MTGIRILIVDSDVIVAASTEAVLKGYGFNAIYTALSLDEAYSYINHNIPNVVVMDISIGENDSALGVKLAREFRKKDVPVIFLTAHSDPDIQNLALSTSPFGYFTKPVAGQDLKNAIEIAYFRANMERRLRESEEKYRTLFNLVPIAITLTNKSGQIVESNEMAEKILGITKNAQQGLFVHGSNWKIVRPDGSSMPAEEYASVRALNEGRLVKDVEMGLVKDSDDITWISVTAAPLLASGYGVAIAYNDITEQKKAQKQFELNYRRTEALLGLALLKEKSIEELAQFFLDKIITITNSTIGFVNIISEDGSKYLPIAYSRETMAGCTMEKVSHFQKAGVGWLLEIVDTHRPLVVNDYENASSPFKKGIPPGHAQLKRFLAVPVVENNRIVALAGVANKPEHYTDADVDELQIMLESFWFICMRRRNEESIARERTRLMTLVENIPDEVYQKDLECRYVFVNKKALEAHSLTDINAMAGKTDFDFLPAQMAKESFAYDRVVIKDAETIANEICLEKGEQRIWYSITKIPLMQEGGAVSGILEIRRNTTELHEALESLKIAKEHAEEANKAKSSFLAAMSHELRTPLNAIIGFAEIIEDLQCDKEQLHTYIEHIRTSGEHLLQLVNDILDISKIEAGKLELEKKEFLIEDVVRQGYSAIVPIARKKQISVELNIAPGIGVLFADEIRIRQILLNLLSNAVKFTSAGKRIGIRATAEDERVMFEVWDEGIGIAVGDLKKIFRPFEQAKGRRMSQAGGTGLGLTIVKRLVEMHGGTIEVQSEVDRGSSFKVFLPERKPAYVEYAAGERPESTSRPDECKFDGVNVLVVDDNEINLELMRLILSKACCNVTLASSGEEALKKIRTNNFDIIFMDIQLSGMDGVEATKEIRKIAKNHIPVIALTAHAMEKDRERFLSSGLDDYLEKPVRIEKVYDMLKKHLHLKNTNV